MRNRLLPAIACLVALGCSHRHLLLSQAPIGTRAVADKVAKSWRITLVVQGTGWTVTSPEAGLGPDAKEDGPRTRIQWTVSEARWKAEGDYPITLAKDGQQITLNVRNRSSEAQVAEGVAIGVAAVAIVALAVASSSSHSSGSHAKAAPKPSPKPGPKPGPTPGPKASGGPWAGSAAHPIRVHEPRSGPVFVPTLVFSDAEVPAIAVTEPLLSLELGEDEQLPGPLSTTLRPDRDGWVAEVGLQDVPEDQIWTATGIGFEVACGRDAHELTASWVFTRLDWESGRAFDLEFQGPDRTCKVRVQLH